MNFDLRQSDKEHPLLVRRIRTLEAALWQAREALGVAARYAALEE